MLFLDIPPLGAYCRGWLVQGLLSISSPSHSSVCKQPLSVRAAAFLRRQGSSASCLRASPSVSAQFANSKQEAIWVIPEIFLSQLTNLQDLSSGSSPYIWPINSQQISSSYQIWFLASTLNSLSPVVPTWWYPIDTNHSLLFSSPFASLPGGSVLRIDQQLICLSLGLSLDCNQLVPLVNCLSSPLSL